MHFVGHVSDEELVAFYDVADLFLCASEHEGFCVPIVEAFYKQVPVLAYAATAVPSTMDGAGVLFENQRSDPRRRADGRDRLERRSRRIAIVDGQLAAVDRLRAKDFAGTLLGFVDRILAGPRAPAPHVAFDFWEQFDAAQELEELRLYRPAIYQALPLLSAEGSLMIVNQWVPAAHEGDAIGDSARRVRDLLRAMGHESELYALTIDDDLRARRAAVRRSGGDARATLTIFHYALPSPMTEAFASLPARPRPAVPQRHAGVVSSRPTIRRCSGSPRSAGDELATLAGRVDLALGDSEYNRQELEALGFARTGVFPIAVDTSRGSPSRPRGRRSTRILDDGLVNFLFVGRIAPNKKIEDIIRLAELYKRYVDAYYRFIFVGRFDVVPRYYAMIRALMAEYRFLNDRFSSPARSPTKSSRSTTGTPRSTSR